MTYIQDLKKLEQLSDEEITTMYRNEMVYLTDRKDMFLSVYSNRSMVERFDYNNALNDDDDGEITLTKDDLIYLHEQGGLIEDDTTTIIFSDEETGIISRSISAASQATVEQALDYMSSVSTIFLASMLRSMGIDKLLDLRYGTNPVFGGLNSDAHIHLQNMQGFVGLCDVCMKEIALSNSVRKPKISGGWDGWFCSEDCMSQYVTDSGETDTAMYMYTNMLFMISF
jgi:hypothetical protein